MWFVFTLLLFSLMNADSEHVWKKYCSGVDPNQCTVNAVEVDPCEQGPAYCRIKKDKKYALTLDLSPKFSAQKMKLAINADVQNDGSYSTVIQAPKDACGYLTCPVEVEKKKVFDVDLTLDKIAYGKFPLQVKLWNEEDEFQACCFTFNVKVK